LNFLKDRYQISKNFIIIISDNYFFVHIADFIETTRIITQS